MTANDGEVVYQYRRPGETYWCEFGNGPELFARLQAERPTYETRVMHVVKPAEPASDAVLPCDVKVAPATTIHAGCPMSTLLTCINTRRDEGAPYRFSPKKTAEPAGRVVDPETDARNAIGDILHPFLDLGTHGAPDWAIALAHALEHPERHGLPGKSPAAPVVPADVMEAAKWCAQNSATAGPLVLTFLQSLDGENNG